MTRAEFTQYIWDTYSIEPDYPFSGDDTSAVFRHTSNRKWFALVMNIPARRIDLPSDTHVDIVNMKCSPVLMGSFRGTSGFFPAYHMSKENWITAALDGSAPDEAIKTLLDMSYQATLPKVKAKRSPETD